MSIVSYTESIDERAVLLSRARTVSPAVDDYLNNHTYMLENTTLDTTEDGAPILRMNEPGAITEDRIRAGAFRYLYEELEGIGVWFADGTDEALGSLTGLRDLVELAEHLGPVRFPQMITGLDRPTLERIHEAMSEASGTGEGYWMEPPDTLHPLLEILSDALGIDSWYRRVLETGRHVANAKFATYVVELIEVVLETSVEPLSEPSHLVHEYLQILHRHVEDVKLAITVLMRQFPEDLQDSDHALLDHEMRIHDSDLASIDVAERAIACQVTDGSVSREASPADEDRHHHAMRHHIEHYLQLRRPPTNAESMAIVADRWGREQTKDKFSRKINAILDRGRPVLGGQRKTLLRYAKHIHNTMGGSDAAS